ncbi:MULTISPECIES: hypothetical protein [unclassified Corynebacterium]|uniref:hypothetical protein n=1 Tax=unclassified Corynebacterium TaxID=2624378 RepID=UPI0029CA4F4D|nr:MULTISPECIES: hypothetical protein [unclassified Corynebacterium]WPF67036.1 hypothetical protein OLX12_04775 [Corynebacterium sp. 22KM0430]WPF69524.1 hypothetical protein OLW90_04770 [Corynebacterium sp. 21KM1197]
MLGTLLSSALAGLLALNPFISPADHIPDIASGSTASDVAAASPAKETSEAAEATEDIDPGFFIHGGQLAVNRAVFEEEQAAGHKLLTVSFTGDHSVTLQQAETFDYEKDAAAFDRIVEVLKINGYDQIAMMAPPLVAE